MNNLQGAAPSDGSTNRLLIPLTDQERISLHDDIVKIRDGISDKKNLHLKRISAEVGRQNEAAKVRMETDMCRFVLANKDVYHANIRTAKSGSPNIHLYEIQVGRHSSFMKHLKGE